MLGPIQAMQVVDLISGEHGAISVIRQKPPARQDVVVCKIPTAEVCGVELLPKPRFAPAISAGCPGKPGGIPGPLRSSGGDTQRGGGAGSRSRCTPTGPADISMAGSSAHSSDI